MFDRFTDRARKVMGLARQEAQRFNHDYIGTEHILLGLIQEGSGVAADVLKNLDVDPKRIAKARDRIRTAAAGIRARDYTPKPDYLACTYCAFRDFCPSSVAR